MTESIVFLANEEFEIISSKAQVLGNTPCLLLKNLKDKGGRNEYAHLTINSLNTLKLLSNKDVILYENLKKLPLINPEIKFLSYKISDNLYLERFYYFENYIIGGLFTNRNKKIWNENEMIELLESHDIHIDNVVANCNVLINENKLDDFELIERTDYVLPKQEVHDFLNGLDQEESFILKQVVDCINTGLVCDPRGVIRFKERPLTDKESILNEDMNKAWKKYFKGEISLREIIEIRCKANASVCYFFESFAQFFYHKHPRVPHP